MSTSFLVASFPIGRLSRRRTGAAHRAAGIGAASHDVIMKAGLPQAMPRFFAAPGFIGPIIGETPATNGRIGHPALMASSR